MRMEGFPVVQANGRSINDILLRGGEPDRNVTMVPLQFHFHSVSEHAVDGILARPPHAAPGANCTLMSPLHCNACKTTRHCVHLG